MCILPSPFCRKFVTVQSGSSWKGLVGLDRFVTCSGNTWASKTVVSMSAKQTATTLKQVRASGPLVQCVTNYVSMDIMANVLIAAKMSPAMAHGGTNGEAAEFAKIASCVNLNLGSLDNDRAIGAKAAAKVCNDMKKPWVLDPVGFGALSYRTGVIKDLINMGPTVLKAMPPRWSRARN
jgi:hypothetical protein